MRGTLEENLSTQRKTFQDLEFPEEKKANVEEIEKKRAANAGEAGVNKEDATQIAHRRESTNECFLHSQTQNGNIQSSEG